MRKNRRIICANTPPLRYVEFHCFRQAQVHRHLVPLVKTVPLSIIMKHQLPLSTVGHQSATISITSVSAPGTIHHFLILIPIPNKFIFEPQLKFWYVLGNSNNPLVPGVKMVMEFVNHGIRAYWYNVIMFHEMTRIICKCVRQIDIIPCGKIIVCIHFLGYNPVKNLKDMLLERLLTESSLIRQIGCTCTIREVHLKIKIGSENMVQEVVGMGKSRRWA